MFRVEFVTSFTTDPTVYTFTVDGIKFVDMPKKGKIGNGGGDGGNFAKNRSINGFGTSSAVDSGANTNYTAPAAAPSSSNNRSSGFGQQSQSAQPAPSHAVTSTSRRFVYDDDEEEAPKTATPAAAPRANFQSPFAPTNTATNAGFGFDPFDESPAPAPAAKSSAAASLFDAFDESPQPAKTATKKASGTNFDAFGSDPFGASSDPFASPAPAAAPAQRTPASQPAKAAAPAPKAAAPAPAPAASKAVPNFFDDDFAPAAPPAAPAANDFGNFGAAPAAPQRRSSAVEISNDFAGLTFAAAPAPAPVMAAAPAPVMAPAPVAEAAPASNDPWSQSNLVNLDLSGRDAAPKRPSATTQGPSLASMMHVPTNSRASFTAGSPSATMPMAAAAPLAPMGAPMGGLPQGQNTRASFTGGPNAGGMGGPGGPGGLGGLGSVPHQQGGSMAFGNQQPFGAGLPNNNNTRGSFTAPGANPGMGGFVGMGAPVGGAMGGNTMGNNSMGMGGMGGMNNNTNTRGSFIAANPTPGMGTYGTAQQSQPPKSSLDTLEWKF